MMRSQRTGNRYLAALVVAFALLHLGVTAAKAAMEPVLWVDFAALGAAPAAIAIFLGFRAWKDRGTSSWALSAAGLLILLVALAVSHLATVKF